MNESEQYFSNLQNLATAQDKAKFRALALTFHSTLQRLPALKKELDVMLESTEALDYGALLAWVEPPLEKAANLLLEIDMLPSELRNHQQIKDFSHALAATLTVRTVEVLSKKFHDLLVRDIPQRIAEEKRLAEKKEQQRLAAEREAQVPDIIKNMVLVKIPAGSCRLGENNEHLVTIPHDFYLGKYLVTQAQWQAVMGNNPSDFKGERLPVETVSWLDVQIFIENLNRLTGLSYCLPTEAQWEYACRAGTITPYYTGNDITPLQANFGNNVGQTTAVGSYPPNPWGLYDMVGNVFEWTDSDYVDNYGKAMLRGDKTDTSSWRVLRGGSWNYDPPYLRSASRGTNTPDFHYSNVGFRLSKM